VVAYEYRRQGVASLLMDALIQEAIALEMIGLTLEVRVNNKAALSLYNNFGFVIEGYRKNYYSHPNEDAAIMWKEFKDGAK
jgi:ribosomal-protein-alanine N-acetyltransferase